MQESNAKSKHGQYSCHALDAQNNVVKPFLRHFVVVFVVLIVVLTINVHTFPIVLPLYCPKIISKDEENNNLCQEIYYEKIDSIQEQIMKNYLRLKQ